MKREVGVVRIFSNQEGHVRIESEETSESIFGDMARPFARTAVAFLNGEWKES